MIMIATAGRCTAAKPGRMVIEWVVECGDRGDVIITDEGAFVLPLRSFPPPDLACSDQGRQTRGARLHPG